MLSSKKRLSTTLFKEVILRGSIFHGTFSVLRCQNSQGISRFGVSVPKKVAKTAVSRNKIRRRVYSVIKSLESGLISGKNVVIVMKAGSEKAHFEELNKETEKIFVKSGLLK